MSGFDLRAPLSIAALALLCQCLPTADQADPPDISPLLSAYAEPTGTIDAAHPAPWLDAAQAQLDLLGGGAARVLVRGLLNSSREVVEQAALPTGGDGLLPTRVDGVATFTLRCGEAGDGAANVAVEIVNGKPSPLLWGTAHACVLLKSRSIRAAYDGSFAIYRYASGRILVRLDGTITGVVAPPIQLDFRLAEDWLETRLATSTGDVIAARDGVELVARAANGTFRCDATEKSCAVPTLAP